jgi:transposase
LRALFKQQLKQLVAAIRRYRALAERLDLIVSIDGIALRTAVAILLRVPEIGRISRQQIAALAGLAPYDNESCDQSITRHIEGGRQRLRNNMYNAAFAASFHWNAELTALYQRLTAAGKEHKLALVACARKLLIYANAVVARGTPWVSRAVAH